MGNWFYYDKGSRGPFPAEELKKMYTEHRIEDSTYVQKEGNLLWMKYISRLELLESEIDTSIFMDKNVQKYVLPEGTINEKKLSEGTAYHNFKIFSKYDKRVFELIEDAEHSARVDYKTCAMKIRIAAETFMKHVLIDYYKNTDSSKWKIKTHKEKYKDKNGVWREKIKDLNEYTIASEYIPLANLINYGVSCVPTLNAIKGKLYKIKDLGNKGPHSEDEKKYITKEEQDYIDENPIITYEEIEKGFSDFYIVLKEYYRSQLEKENIQVNNKKIKKSRIPFNDSYIFKSRQFSSKIANCICEYYVQGNDDSDSKYGIIREYEYSKQLEDILKREIDTMHRIKTDADEENIYGIPEIKKIETKDNKKLFIKYCFNNKPSLLDQNFLKSFQSPSNAMKICTDILNIFKKLHENNIYHRFLTPECVVVCKRKNEYVPFIKDFVFTKFEDNRDLNTIVNAFNDIIENDVHDQLLAKYKAIIESGETDYEMVDVRCLGLLIGDILNFELSEFEFDSEDLLERGYPEKVVTMLQRMIDPVDRVTVKEAYECFIG